MLLWRLSPLRRGVSPCQRGTLWMSMSPVPDDGTGEPGRTIRSFGGAVMAFAGCGGPGLLPGDSGLGNALPQIPRIVCFPPTFNSPHQLTLVDQCLALYPCPGHRDGERIAFYCRSLWRRFMLKHFARYLLVPVLYSPHLPPSAVSDAGRIAHSRSGDVRLMLAVSHRWPLGLDHFRPFLGI